MKLQRQKRLLQASIGLLGLFVFSFWIGNCSEPPGNNPEWVTEWIDASGIERMTRIDSSQPQERQVVEVPKESNQPRDRGNPPPDRGNPPPDRGNPPPDRGNPPPDTRNKPYGLTKRVPNTTCKLLGKPASLATMKAKLVFTNLLFNRPIYVTHAPDGSNRMFVVEQRGIIRVFNNNPSVQSAQVFLDITSKVNSSGNEMGLLGLAFHPKYKTNGYFYVYYSDFNRRRANHHSIVARYKVSSGSPNKADSSSEKKLMSIPQPYSNHNGGMIEFGPDGYLYISLGDGGSAGDPRNTGQTLSSLLGKILRIDVDKPIGGGIEYGIPKDNPFVSNPTAAKEVWAWGLRNVWRFSFDRVTGDLWAGDVGQGALEEISLITRGGNYGWRNMEGTRCYNPRINCKKPGMILPIVEHGRSEAKSITGGYVYRGKKIPQLYGAYIYADYVTGKFWALRYNGKKVTEKKFLMDSFKNISSFGEDKDGELYFTTFETRNREGRVYTLEPSSGSTSSTFPLTLSQTGCFASLKPLKPAAGLIPYGVNVQLWSDGLDKQRWIALPGTSQITYKAEDSWDFPENSVIVKHFSIQTTKGNETTRRSIETRFMVKQAGVWKAYSYLWNKDQTDATLLEGNAKVQVKQTDPSNAANNIAFTHTVPNRTECMQCHTAAAGRVLGLETLQINGDFNYNGVVDNQLRAMNHINLFTQPISPPNTHPALPKIEDKNVPIEQRARSYLHANCSYCHRPNVAGAADTDMRFKIKLPNTKMCNVSPQKGDLGVSGAKILTPGKPESSTVFLRMKKRGKDQMPQLGTVRSHDEAVNVIRQWIKGLQDCN